MPYFKPTRASFIPKTGATKISAKACEAVAYISETIHKPTGATVFYAMGFAGKAQKPTFHFSFKTADSRAKYVAQWIAEQTNRAKRKAEARAAQKAWRHDFKVGDVLRSSWGYDQTNIDWYEVTEVNGAHIIIREIAAMSEENGWMTGKCAPVPGDYIGEPMQRRPTSDGVIGKYDHTRAYRVAPETVGGLKVYEPARWSSYA